MSLNYVTITETFTDGSGNPALGSATFTPSAVVYASGVPQVTPATPIQASIVSGALRGPTGGSLTLLATDNAGLTIEGQTGFWFWTVTVQIGAALSSFSFFLPHTPSPVELYALANTAAGGGGGGINPPAGDIGGTTSSPTVVSTHLTAALPVGQGGTGQATQQAALNALAGATTANEVLAGNGTNVTLRSLTSADMPAGVGDPAYRFRPENYGAKADGVEFLVTTTAGSSTITSSTPVFTSTLVDAGKSFMACGAGGAIPGGPWVDTIATVISSTQATTVGTCPTNGSGSGLAAVFSSDDRVAIDSCVSAAATYAMANNYFAEVFFRDKIYGLGPNLFQSQQGVSGALLTYNTQVRIPVPTDQTGETEKLEIRFTGAGTGGHCQFWTSKNLNVPGTALVSYNVGPNTANGTFGQQSLMGAPGAGSGTIANDFGFFNVKVVVQGITLVQPGWSNSIGLDCQWAAAMRCDGVTSTAFAPSTALGGGVNGYGPGSGSGNWLGSSFWINNKIDAGFQLPNVGNNDEILLNSLCVQGLNIGALTQGDHVDINRMSVNTVNHVIQFSNTAANTHAVNINQGSFENVNTMINVPNGSGGKIQCNITLDGENTTIGGDDVNDPNNNLYGIVYWSDQFRSPAVPTVVGAANLVIINNMLGPGHMASPPSVPGSTSAASKVYRHASVAIHTGAGVTVSAITIDGTATGLTMAASSTVVVRVPSGKTIALTYSGGTPTWDWWLE